MASEASEWVTARWDGATLTVRVGAAEAYGERARTAAAVRDVIDPALVEPVQAALAAVLAARGRSARRAARLAAAQSLVAAAAMGEEQVDDEPE